MFLSSSPSWNSKSAMRGGNILAGASVHCSSAQSNHRRLWQRRRDVRSTSMSMGSGSRSGVNSEINVTPMIDVLLVLLIIFMVILPHHVWGERALIAMPPDNPDPRPEPAVVIQLHDRGPHSVPGLTINEQEVAWPDLDSKLRGIFARRIEQVAFLKGDPEIDFQYVAEALDTAHH